MKYYVIIRVGRASEIPVAIFENRPDAVNKMTFLINRDGVDEWRDTPDNFHSFYIYKMNTGMLNDYSTLIDSHEGEHGRGGCQ